MRRHVLVTIDDTLPPDVEPDLLLEVHTVVALPALGVRGTVRALAPASPHAAYHERNMLVAYLATCYPAHLARHPEQEPWDDDWRWLVCVHTPAGQMTWHIHDSEYDLFRWLPARDNDWDGHTTEEKYTCLLGFIIERGKTHA